MGDAQSKGAGEDQRIYTDQQPNEEIKAPEVDFFEMYSSKKGEVLSEEDLTGIHAGDSTELVVKSKADDKLYCIKVLISKFDDQTTPLVQKRLNQYNAAI